MTRPLPPMVCPDCGVEMNRHAEKLVMSGDPGDVPGVDPELGGVIEEAHSCPGCGRTETRVSS